MTGRRDSDGGTQPMNEQDKLNGLRLFLADSEPPTPVLPSLEAISARQQRERDPLPQQVHDHIASLIANFSGALRTKYIKGYYEHGGDLRTKFTAGQLLDEVENEILDLWVYTRTLRERLEGEKGPKASP